MYMKLTNNLYKLPLYLFIKIKKHKDFLAFYFLIFIILFLLNQYFSCYFVSIFYKLVVLLSNQSCNSASLVTFIKSIKDGIKTLLTLPLKLQLNGHF